MSSHSVSNRVRALRAFFAWVADQEYSKDHVLKKLKVPRTSIQVIEPLNRGEINKVFAAINPNTFIGARNTALISLMLDAGLRLSECAGLKLTDAHIDERFIKVVGKGAKERIVAFGVTCQKALLRYALQFRVEPAHSGVDSFFLTIDGYPLTNQGIQSLFVRLSRSSGVPRLHPHLLRHTYATSFLLNGGDVFLLRQNLGHSTLSMVENYVHITSQIAAVQSQAFPPISFLQVL